MNLEDKAAIQQQLLEFEDISWFSDKMMKSLIFKRFGK